MKEWKSGGQRRSKSTDIQTSNRLSTSPAVGHGYIKKNKWDTISKASQEGISPPPPYSNRSIAPNAFINKCEAKYICNQNIHSNPHNNTYFINSNVDCDNSHAVGYHKTKMSSASLGSQFGDNLQNERIPIASSILAEVCTSTASVVSSSIL